MSITIKPAQPEDARTIVLLTEQAEDARSYKPVLTIVQDTEAVKARREDLLKQSTWAAIAYDLDRPVGCIFGRPVEETHGLEHLSVLMIHPGYWGKGIGTSLVNWMKRELIAKGSEMVDLWTEDSNTRARELYEHLGFIATGEEKYNEKYKQQQVRYILSLSSPNGS